jgi:outer membrane protein TolC
LLLNPVRAQTGPQDLLSLEAVWSAALAHQPILEAQAASIAALGDRAVAAGELPDPELITGISELPVNTDEAWSFTRDGDTDVMIGVMQAFPRAAKRRLRRTQFELEAASARAELEELNRRVRLEAGLAFLDLLFAEKSAQLTAAQTVAARSLLDASVIAQRAGNVNQGRTLAAKVALHDLEDRELEARQQAAAARARLRRWIGERADLELDETLPRLPPPQLPGDLERHLAHHPTLDMLERRQAAAESGIELAQAEYRPDWRVELSYGYRPAFSEMLSLRFSVGLPWFTADRQDRAVAAARHEARAAAARRDDELQHHVSALEGAFDVWRITQERLRSYRDGALPAASTQVDAELASFRAGRVPLTQVFEARSALLDVELKVLGLDIDALRRQLEIRYFLVEAGT